MKMMSCAIGNDGAIKGNLVGNEIILISCNKKIPESTYSNCGCITWNLSELNIGLID